MNAETSQYQHWVMVNGSWQSSIAQADPALDRAGFFETLLYCNGELPLKDWHWRRLLTTAKRLAVPVDLSWLDKNLGIYLSKLSEIGKPDDRVAIKITVAHTPCASDQNASFPSTVIFQSRLITGARDPGLRLKLCVTPIAEKQDTAGLKLLNRATYNSAAKELAVGDDDGILLSSSGLVIETLIRNLFWCEQGRLYTPKLNLAGVAGVMRTYLNVKVAPALGVDVIEVDAPAIQLQQADEVFVCNAVRGVQYVRQLDQLHWEKGPITQALQKFLNQELPNAFS